MVTLFCYSLFMLCRAKEVVDQHRASLDPDNPRDLIDCYLLEMERQKDSPSVIFNGREKPAFAPRRPSKLSPSQGP